MQPFLHKPQRISLALFAILFAEILLLSNMIFRATLFMIYPYPYKALIQEISKKTDVPEVEILATIKVESNFNETALSYRGAVGLMQVLPDTFNWLSDRFDLPIDSVYNKADNIYAGTVYLSYLYDKYHDWNLVHAAYNAGDGTVDRWLKDPRYSYEGILQHIPYSETAQYLVRIEQTKYMYQTLYFNEKEKR